MARLIITSFSFSCLVCPTFMAWEIKDYKNVIVEVMGGGQLTG
jgi:hypothetical protein